MLAPEIVDAIVIGVSGFNSAVVVRMLFKLGAWYGQVNSRLDTVDREQSHVASRLSRVEQAVYSIPRTR